jgi:hypothetical protein
LAADFLDGFYILNSVHLISLQRQRLQKTVLKRQGSLAKTRPAENCLEETGPGRLVSFYWGSSVIIRIDKLGLGQQSDNYRASYERKCIQNVFKIAIESQKYLSFSKAE